MTINTNVGALKARVANFAAQTNMEKAMERLSSGLQIQFSLMTPLVWPLPLRWKVKFAE